MIEFIKFGIFIVLAFYVGSIVLSLLFTFVVFIISFISLIVSMFSRE